MISTALYDSFLNKTGLRLQEIHLNHYKFVKNGTSRLRMPPRVLFPCSGVAQIAQEKLRHKSNHHYTDLCWSPALKNISCVLYQTFLILVLFQCLYGQNYHNFGRAIPKHPVDFIFVTTLFPVESNLKTNFTVPSAVIKCKIEAYRDMWRQKYRNTKDKFIFLRRILSLIL